MAKPFFRRLNQYFETIGQVLRGEASSASIFPNSSDIGLQRELVYVEFLKQHAPSKCNVFLGGFLFGEDGNESKQLDVIISTDTSPRFDFNNSNGKGKSFASVKGCLGVASIKSFLDKAQLIDSLDNLASVPQLKALGSEGNTVAPTVKVRNYENWPYKIIYSSNGLEATTLLNHLNNYYAQHTDIPTSRKPDLIHVAGKYIIVKLKPGTEIFNPDGSRQENKSESFTYLNVSPDVQGLTLVLNELQQIASASSMISYSYNEIINSIHS